MTKYGPTQDHDKTKPEHAPNLCTSFAAGSRESEGTSEMDGTTGTGGRFGHGDNEGSDLKQKDFKPTDAYLSRVAQLVTHSHI